MQQENLIFLIGSPRSGSTMLQRMVASHSQIATHPEPHLITPLNYLGYYQTVDKAPYDHINAAQALREFAQELPHGEEDYLDACRAYASTLYGRVLSKLGGTHFLDKTPAYGLILPFLTKLYPHAKYIVLTRHPLAVWHSVAHSFFEGNYALAQQTNPVMSEHVPAIGQFIIDKPVPFVHVRYEDVVQNPEAQMQRIFEHLGLPFEPDVVNYGQKSHITKSYGDPMSVEKHTRPVQDSMESFAQDLLARPEALELAKEVVGTLSDAHLAAWGYPKETLLSALEGKSAIPTKKPFNTYRFKRQVLISLRKNIHHNALGSAVKKVRYFCDVLLRT